MKSKVFFSKDIDKASIQKLFKAAGFEKFIKPKEFVALKIHFGEEKNKGFIKPEFARVIVDQVRALGARPFLTDTNVLYKGRRTNAIDHLMLAAEHGFEYKNLNCPVIIADGLRGSDYQDIAVKGRHFNSVKIANAAIESDAIIGIAHVTGHIVSGYGGAIKNIGMGFASRGGKLMQHFGISPKISEEICKGCGECIEICPQNAIKRTKTLKSEIIKERCIGCGECIVTCRFDAIEICWREDPRLLQERMAEYAFGALKDKKNRCGFINFANHITADCDCLAKDEHPITADLGILASTDIVSLDKATCDLLIKRDKKDIFKDTYPKIDWSIQIGHAAELGLGNIEYDFIDIKYK